MEHFKAVLTNRKKQLLDNIKTNLDPQINHHVSAVDQLDFAANESNKMVLAEMKAKDMVLVNKITRALSKFPHNTFGLCERCESEIETKRLTAQPWATHCLGCQEVEDAKSRKYPTRKPQVSLLDVEEYKDEIEGDGLCS